jgi:hypothetical protein
MSDSDKVTKEQGEKKGRRDFLKECAKYAAVTAPAMMLLLSPDEGVAGGHGHGHGHGHGGPHGYGHHHRRRHHHRARRRRRWRRWRQARRFRD